MSYLFFMGGIMTFFFSREINMFSRCVVQYLAAIDIIFNLK